MPTKAEIQRAAQRIQEGDGIISTILQMKQDATEALKTGDMVKLKKAGAQDFLLRCCFPIILFLTKTA